MDDAVGRAQDRGTHRVRVEDGVGLGQRRDGDSAELREDEIEAAPGEALARIAVGEEHAGEVVLEPATGSA